MGRLTRLQHTSGTDPGSNCCPGPLSSSCGLGASPRQRECDIGDPCPHLGTLSGHCLCNFHPKQTPSCQGSCHRALPISPPCTRPHLHSPSTCKVILWRLFQCPLVGSDAFLPRLVVKSLCAFSFSSRRLELLPESVPCSPSSVPNHELGGRAVGL